MRESDKILLRKSGRIERKGIRYLLIRPETLIEFQKGVEKELGRHTAAKIMARAGFTGGGKSIKRYKEKFQLSNRALAKFTCSAGTSLGWGRLRLAKLTKKELVIEVSGSPFAEAYGPSPEPVCHFIRGVVEALGSAFFEQKTEAQETRCLAKGDRVCQFVVLCLSPR